MLIECITFIINSGVVKLNKSIKYCHVLFASISNTVTFCMDINLSAAIDSIKNFKFLENLQKLLSLTHFQPMFLFYTP